MPGMQTRPPRSPHSFLTQHTQDFPEHRAGGNDAGVPRWELRKLLASRSWVSAVDPHALCGPRLRCPVHRKVDSNHGHCRQTLTARGRAVPSTRLRSRWSGRSLSPGRGPARTALLGTRKAASRPCCRDSGFSAARLPLRLSSDEGSQQNDTGPGWLGGCARAQRCLGSTTRGAGPGGHTARRKGGCYRQHQGPGQDRTEAPDKERAWPCPAPRPRQPPTVQARLLPPILPGQWPRALAGGPASHMAGLGAAGRGPPGAAPARHAEPFLSCYKWPSCLHEPLCEALARLVHLKDHSSPPQFINHGGQRAECHHGVEAPRST